ncbi:FapA family protein [Pseudothermotoga hypogea]|uniref:FapA family protein n=1 Tax=Pseudothermotoga hypogea TaxID=57487 RepID=UPI000422CECB|nr:FapA family protein [Pseudothermotoga hypogea]
MIDKDLGYDTGNIDFNGSVVIRKNAEGPFKVRVKADLLILGVLGEIHEDCGGSLKFPFLIDSIETHPLYEVIQSATDVSIPHRFD